MTVKNVKNVKVVDLTAKNVRVMDAVPNVIKNVSRALAHAHKS
jgi:hypothetical protein